MTLEMTGAVLAGGESTRMGKDKGFLQWRGKPLVQHVADVLAEVCSPVMIIGDRPERFRELGFSCSDDLIPHAGPLGGIHTALTQSSTDRVFICACDLPRVSADAVRYVVDSATPSHEISIAQHNDTLQPLFGIYSKTCLDDLTTFLHNGGRKVRDFLKDRAIGIVDLGPLPSHVPSDVLRNINTPGDYEELIREPLRKSL